MVGHDKFALIAGSLALDYGDDLGDHFARSFDDHRVTDAYAESPDLVFIVER